MTSYQNYIGLKKGDADFEGYISKGDINGNVRIDAYDISVVATQLNGGVAENQVENSLELAGKLSISPDKADYKAGETINITVNGEHLSKVNALGFALPYNAQDLEFVKIRPLNLKSMEGLTLDRLHTDGTKVLYPTFINFGERETLNEGKAQFVIEMKAKKDFHFPLKPSSGVIVDKQLNEQNPW